MDMRAPCAGPWSGASPGGHHGGADQPVRSFRWRNLAHHVPQGAVMTFTAVPLTLYPDMFPGPLGHSMAGRALERGTWARSEEHTSELQSLMRISYAVFCLQKKTTMSTNVYNA